MVIQVDKEGHKVLSVLADSYLKVNGLQALTFVQSLTAGIQLLPETPETPEIPFPKEEGLTAKVISKKKKDDNNTENKK